MFDPGPTVALLGSPDALGVDIDLVATTSEDRRLQKKTDKRPWSQSVLH